MADWATSALATVGIPFNGIASVPTAGLAGEGAGDDNDGAVGRAQPELNLADL